MSKIAYINKRFKASTAAIIESAERICEEYAAQGYDLTLRQIYYRFIARKLFPDTWIDPEYNRRKGLPPNTKNTDKNYKRLGSIINSGRMAGLLDWNIIVDRTRKLEHNAHSESAASLVRSCASWFQIDKWSPDYQSNYVELWIEKDTLLGVISGTCEELDVPYFSARGYCSQSAMWRAGRRLAAHRREGQTPHILQISDHDPSGIDMRRDIHDRLETFAGEEVEVRRLALTIDQVRAANAPPDPAKITDSRAEAYISEFGNESWEVEALEPAQLNEIVRDAVEDLRDIGGWETAQEIERQGRERLSDVADELEDE